LKPIRTTKEWNYDSLILYREDLEQLIRIFNPTRAGDIITISDHDNQYDSLDDLAQFKGPHIRGLTIRSRKPHIGLILNKSRNILTLFTADATDEADMAYYEAHDLLHSKMRPLFRWTRGIMPLLVVFFVLVAGLAYKRFINSGWALVALSCLLLPFVIFNELITKQTACFISLKRRHEEENFWQRNKDDFIKMLIGAAIGSIITFLTRHFLK